MKKLRIAVQTETALFRLKTRQSFRSLALLALASVFALMALRVLNEAAFEALSAEVGALFAGLIIGSVDLALGSLLLRAALDEPAETEEEKLAQRLRDLTYSSLGEDVDEMQAELHSFLEEIRRIRKTVGSVTSGLSGSMSLVFDFMEGLSRVQEKTEKSTLSADKPTA